MHYQVVYSNQFKRDLKAARKQGHDLKKLFMSLIVCAVVNLSRPGFMTTLWAEGIHPTENVILNRIGFWFIKETIHC